MVRVEDYAGLKEKFGDVLGVIGDLCRSMLVPAPGHHFIVGDFSAIEARVLTWLAGDEKKLEAFRQFDLGIGRDLYCIAAEQVLGLTEVGRKSRERGLGKEFELGLGYSMGSVRLLTRVQRAGYHATIQDTTRWVNKWREQNPKIVNFWRDLKNAAIAAVQRPGELKLCGVVSFEMWDGVLSLRLPSGREVKYPNPILEPGEFGLQIRLDGYRNERMYGGKWAENVTQAVARDLLVEAMKRMHAVGYTITLHTHDEIAAEELIDSNHTEGEFKQLLIEKPSWAKGLPIAAEVFTCDRFKKN
jgi:DNA polymerase bacteriophage-type